jgi:hypothetical protein
VQTRTKVWIGWTVAVTAVVVFELFFGVDSALGAGVGVVAALVYVVAYIVMVVAVPLVFFTLFKFVFSLWLKPFYRAWHIHRIRNARYLREVIDRGKSGGP